MNQLTNITSLCDGYTEASDDSYKSTFFYVERDGKVQYPFIYHTVLKIEGYIERCIIMVHKDQYLKEENGVKKAFSL